MVRLLKDIRGLREDTVIALEQVHITAVDHLLQQDASELYRLCGISQVELEKACNVVAAAISPRKQLSIPKLEWVSTCIPALDDALGTGLRRGAVTEIGGHGAACLAHCITRNLPADDCVHVIVGGGSGRPCYPGTRLIVGDISKLADCIDAVRSDAVALSTIGCKPPSLVVVDSFSRICAASLALSPNLRVTARATIEKIVSALRLLAAQVTSATLVVAPDCFDGIGRMWEHVPDERIALESDYATFDSDDHIVGPLAGSTVRRRAHDFVNVSVTSKTKPPNVPFRLDLVALREGNEDTDSEKTQREDQ